MLLSNSLHHQQLVSTFDRISGAGGDASLTYKTVGGKVSAVLEVQLGAPSTTRRPAAPEAPHQAEVSWKSEAAANQGHPAAWSPQAPGAWPH